MKTIHVFFFAKKSEHFKATRHGGSYDPKTAFRGYTECTKILGGRHSRRKGQSCEETVKNNQIILKKEIVWKIAKILLRRHGSKAPQHTSHLYLVHVTMATGHYHLCKQIIKLWPCSELFLPLGKIIGFFNLNFNPMSISIQAHWKPITLIEK